MQIHTYARLGDIAGLKRQLANGINIDCLDRFSKTPLMYAVTSSNASLDMVQFLVKNSANINAIDDEENNTVLGLAVQSGNLDKIQYLLDAGADINYQRPSGYDVLIDAMHGRDISKCENLIPIVNLLITRGARLSSITDYGESALKVASNRGRFDVVKLLLTAGDDPRQLEWSELMHAIAFESVEEVKKLIEEGAELDTRDFWSRTPWLLSLQVGELEKAKLLLSSGADPCDRGRCGKTPMMYPIENNRVEILEWLIQKGFDQKEFDIEATDEFDTTPLIVAVECGATDCVKLLLAAGADPSRTIDYDQKAITYANNLEIVKILVDAGEDLNDINDDMRRLLTGVSNNDDICNVSREQYLTGKYRKFGKTNPEVMEVEFWKAMVRSGVGAYSARSIFENERYDEPIWCFERFGRTITQLPDGRILEIGGEHEDYYDPDFCIYNDVVVHQGDGSFTILGYPKDIFPPTDFHSATLVGKYVYIIGCLGYLSERIYNQTPVYRLHSETFKIEKVETTGEKPGWISRHKAHYQEQSKIFLTGGKVCVKLNDKDEYVENSNDYILNLANMNWSRVHG